MKVRISLLSKVGMLALLVWTQAVFAISEEALARGLPSLAPMLEEVTPAVVNIRVTKTIPTAGQFSFDGENLPESVRRYFESLPNSGPSLGQRPYATGAGSGVIVDAEQGFIITNHHVVAGAASITVQLSDKRSVDAELIGSDANTDIALLRIPMDELVSIPMADINTVQVGDYVVAIGNPFGIGQTVTSGIVSALGRAGLNNDNYEDFIQTDAAINVGNSGGALVDLEGRLIGINTAIISGSGGSNGIGFAVPVNMVSAVMEHLQRDGEVRRGMLGVTITDVTPDVISALELNSNLSGALVTSVAVGSAAEAAGLRISDVITEVDGREVRSGRELRNIVGLIRQGTEVRLSLVREGEAMSVSAVIGAAEGAVVADGARPPFNSEFRGARLSSVANNPYAESGVEVVNVQPQSRAWSAGLRQGDVIIEVNRNNVSDLAEFNSSLQDNGRFTALTVLREGRRMLFFVP
ncbi:MAG: Do family serine endopeptidase [Gammaproteobacteria bacterium]